MGERSVLIATPTRGSLTAGFVASLLDLALKLVEAKISFRWLPERTAPIFLSRDLTARFFVDQSDEEFLLFLDDDLAVDPADVMRLLAIGAPVSGIAYRKRTQDRAKHEYTVGMGPAAFDQLVEDDGTIKVGRLGTGCLLVRRDAMVRMVSHYEPLVGYEAKGGTRLPGVFRESFSPSYVSEDYSFCDRWTALGGEVVCLVDAQTVHEGVAEWEGNLALQWNEQQKYIELKRAESEKDQAAQ